MSEGYMCRNRDGCNRNDCGEGLAFRCKADVPQIEPIGQRPIYCSFCGKNDMEVPKLVQAPGNVAICNECCVRCADIMGIKPPQLTDYQKTLAIMVQKEMHFVATNNRPFTGGEYTVDVDECIKNCKRILEVCKQ